MSTPVDKGPPLCRLCGGTLAHVFALTVMGHCRVDYLRCANCGSLQTQAPFWLAEAYASNLADTDTGAGQRVLNNLASAYTVARLFRLNNALDFGGGDGLLCRLLRDYRINAYVQDAHVRPAYAPSYVDPDFERPDLVLSFEVLEHFANPRDDLSAVFGLGAEVVCISTALYSGQDRDWWYLAPDTGQHVFFYSRAAVDLIAHRFGYRAAVCGAYVVFCRPRAGHRWRLAVLGKLLRPAPLRLLRAIMALLPPSGRALDFERLSATHAPVKRPEDRDDGPTGASGASGTSG